MNFGYLLIPLPPFAMNTAVLSSPSSTWREPVNGLLFVALFALAVTQLADLPFIRALGFSPLVVGIVCGMLYGNFLRASTLPAGWGAGVHFAARRLLRIAVAFYGLNISLQQILAVGLPGIAVSLIVVTGTLLLGALIGIKLLKLDRDTAILASAGSAICGAAAVLAFEPMLRAAPHKSAVALAAVVLFGTLAMFFYPAMYHLGWLSDFDTQALGLYIGGTVHEVAQVVGAASNIDPATTEVATIVKMTRVALLVPALLIVTVWLRAAGKRTGDAANRADKLPVPWFAIGFLTLAVVNSLAVLPPDWVASLRKLDIFALTMAMTALGIETRFSQIRTAGPRVLALGGLLFVWLVAGGYAVVWWAM